MLAGVVVSACLAVVLPLKTLSARRDYHHRCPKDGIINGIVSERSGIRYDRAMRFVCRKGLLTFQCENSGYVTKLKESFDFRCPADTVLAGVSSRFDRLARDRQFSFRCCKVRRSRTSTCRKSGWYGASDDIRLQVPPGWAVSELNSQYVGRGGGRSWRIEICYLA
ncbi:dermatopontin-like [Physella acuta]|uniref:dermatopontin-like n=1 Tax=Physella acuta TaxID=109671 RepID=UPI0027DE3CEB|nr:dermatopontin-like [Physella acuta]